MSERGSLSLVLAAAKELITEGESLYNGFLTKDALSSMDRSELITWKTQVVDIFGGLGVNVENVNIPQSLQYLPMFLDTLTRLKSGYAKKSKPLRTSMISYSVGSKSNGVTDIDTVIDYVSRNSTLSEYQTISDLKKSMDKFTDARPMLSAYDKIDPENPGLEKDVDSIYEMMSRLGVTDIDSSSMRIDFNMILKPSVAAILDHVHDVDSTMVTTYYSHDAAGSSPALYEMLNFTGSVPIAISVENGPFAQVEYDIGAGWVAMTSSYKELSMTSATAIRVTSVAGNLTGSFAIILLENSLSVRDLFPSTRMNAPYFDGVVGRFTFGEALKIAGTPGYSPLLETFVNDGYSSDFTNAGSEMSTKASANLTVVPQVEQAIRQNWTNPVYYMVDVSNIAAGTTAGDTEYQYNMWISYWNLVRSAALASSDVVG